jgi:hypothetical protein
LSDCHVTPASVLRKTPVLPPAYQVSGLAGSTAMSVAKPDGRLLSGCQVRPSSIVNAKWRARLVVPPPRWRRSKLPGASACIVRRPLVDVGTGPNSTGFSINSERATCWWCGNSNRLSRSLRDVLTIMERLGEAGAGFRSLTEAIDTTTPAGRMMMQMVGAFAEFERAMLRERTKAGLDSARRDGRIGGRRPKLTPQQQSEIRKMVSKGSKSAADAARLFKVHPATVSRLLARAYAK